MINKALEVIEAYWLRGPPAERIEMPVHLQSIMHSLIEHVDRSVIAQMGRPDMRVSIAIALAYSDRIDSGADGLDPEKAGALALKKPDYGTFPCLRLECEAPTSGGTAPTVLNVANEIAV